MKPIHIVLIFAAGLVIGIPVMFSFTEPVEDSAAEPQETADANSKRPESGKRIKGDRPKPSAAERELRKKEAKREKHRAVTTVKHSAGDGKFELPDDIRAKFRQAHEDSRINEIAAKLATLKARLNLTPDQEAKVAALLEKHSRGKMAFFESIISGDREEGQNKPEAIAGKLKDLITRNPRESLDNAIGELLNDHQATAYSEYREAERKNRIEIAANQRLTALQSMFTLTEDQKNRAYEVFHQQSEESIIANPGSDFGNNIRFNLARDNEPLRDILTPEQFDAYNSSGPQMIFNSIEGATTDGPRAIITEAIRIEDLTGGSDSDK